LAATPILANGVVKPPHGQFGGDRTTPMALKDGLATPQKAKWGWPKQLIIAFGVADRLI
jgi:hypothetical protein